MQINFRKYIFRPFLIFSGILFALILVLFCYVYFKSQISPPDVPPLAIGARKIINEHHFVLGNNYLKKNEFGIWEMYLEGEPYERGLIYGELAKELIRYQEEVFVDQIKQLVPSPTWQKTLTWIIGFFNSDLPNYIPLENQQEIYGISKTFSDDFDFIGPKYVRILNYHAAHDIGHALNDYSMVGCSSFSLKGKRTKDSLMIIGRNFDFYVSDAFARDKMIVFVNPSKGYKFASYSWAGFTGVASGLNEKGLSVTINASKSDIPTASRMPISLLAREILQYASNLSEAIAIAGKRHTFVSETLMIGSEKDGKTILIEKSPSKMDVYDAQSDEVICANHYQSARFRNDDVNIQNIKESDSKYRFVRLQKLLNKNRLLDVKGAADILRDQQDENGDTLGMGNPRAINQLNGHHSVIIIPARKLFYVSTTDFQLGPYIGYDLMKSFNQKRLQITDTISADPMLYSAAYSSYKIFRKQKKEIDSYLQFDEPLNFNSDNIQKFVALNSESYITYETIGKYYQKKGNCDSATKYFTLALTKKVASKKVEEEIKILIEKCSRK